MLEIKFKQLLRKSQKVDSINSNYLYFKYTSSRNQKSSKSLVD